jgi:hypothetical protein
MLFNVKETKGRSLEEIETLFMTHNPQLITHNS